MKERELNRKRKQSREVNDEASRQVIHLINSRL